MAETDKTRREMAANYLHQFCLKSSGFKLSVLAFKQFKKIPKALKFAGHHFEQINSLLSVPKTLYMESSLSKFRKILQKWYLPLIAGVGFIMVAIGIYSLPGLSISIIMLLFSLTIILFGIRETAFVVHNRRRIKKWRWHLGSSLLMLATGIVLISDPLISVSYINSLVVLLLFGKAIQNFIFHYTYSRRTQSTVGINAVYGVALIFIALFLWSSPQIITAFLVTLSGLPFLIMGILCIALSLTLRKTHQKLEAFKRSFQEKTKDATYEVIEE